jgi:hypothetical protein
MALWEDFEKQDGSLQRFSNNPFDYELNDHIEQVSKLSKAPEEMKEPSMLEKRTFNYNSHLGTQITHMVASGDILTIVENGTEIKRFNLRRQILMDRVELHEGIHAIFQDPSGAHLVFSTQISQETHYHHTGMKKAHLVAKSKGHLIESVGWNSYLQTDTSTGPILMGTSKGMIIETEIDCTGDQSFLGKLHQVQHFNQLFLLHMDVDQRGRDPEPVTGLHVQAVKVDNDVKYCIIATTPSRLYQFSGRSSSSSLFMEPVFELIFRPYKGRSGKLPELQEIPGGSETGIIAVWPQAKGESVPKYFAWLTGNGVYFSQFEISGKSPKFLTNSKLIPYSSPKGGVPQIPMGVALTEFHLVLLYRDRLDMVCTINQEVVCQERISGEKLSPMCHMALNLVAMEIVVTREQLIWTYNIVNERRYLWKIYLELERFDLAKRYCQGSEEQMSIIRLKAADSVFSQHKYLEAAKMYAESTAPFEEAALKFLNAKQIEALKLYLNIKLENLPPENKTQQTMLTTWLTEIYLNSLGLLKDNGKMAEFEDVKKEFREFLATERLKMCFDGNKATLYELITSHGFPEETVHLALLLNDYSRVVRHYIQTDEYEKALDTLKGIKKGVSQMYYDFSPALMRHAPQATVDAWMSRKKKLEPVKLIPALVQYNLSKDELKIHNREAIRYLEFCVNSLRVEEVAIHNFLISLYISEQETDKLMAYLEMQGTSPCYDVEYALRQCAEHGLEKACVHVYCVKDLFDEALSLALKVDLDLAKKVADMPDAGFDIEAADHVEELKRKLWLKVAKHVVIDKQDIPQVMQILKECRVLRLEDVLPFFPDFTQIETFKDAICASLDNYSNKIQQLEEDMKTATDCANDLREDMYNIRTK